MIQLEDKQVPYLGTYANLLEFMSRRSLPKPPPPLHSLHPPPPRKQPSQPLIKPTPIEDFGELLVLSGAPKREMPLKRHYRKLGTLAREYSKVQAKRNSMPRLPVYREVIRKGEGDLRMRMRRKMGETGYNYCHQRSLFTERRKLQFQLSAMIKPHDRNIH